MFGHDDHRRIKSRVSHALTVQSHASKVARVIQREHDRIRWELQPDFAPLLEDVLKSAGETVKESPVKRVSRHVAGGKTFYVKRYLHHAVPLRPLKFFFKPTQAQREWDLAQELEARNIPIVRHVALGERRTWAGTLESILITEGFEGVPLSPTMKVDLSTVLAFVGRMHDQGVLQEDLHPANLLARTDPFELRLVDLDGARVLASLTVQQRQENLALLRTFLPVPISRELDEQSRELRKHLLQRRSRRCLRSNREFARQRLGALKWQVRLPLVNETVRRVLSEPDEFLKTRATILKPGRTSTVGKADGLVLKRFNFRKLENLVKDLFRPSRARRAFVKAYHLELAGVPTPRCIAVSSRRACGVLLRSYLLMEEIAGAIDLGTYLRTTRAPDPSLASQAGRLIARLHDEGFSHRDLKESNLVVGADARLSVLDLDSLYFVGKVSERRCAADLARLARGMAKYPVVTASQRAAFLRAYCRARGLRRVPRAP
jgi:tRNA A-37 threonylcarbamoyl transferase component Bud32